MGNNFDKTMAILNGDKSKTATALKTMALDLDKKFEELEDKNTERHEALMKAIADNKFETDRMFDKIKSDTDRKFEKIKVVMFFSENPKWLYLIIIGVTIMMLFTNVGDLIKLIK